MIDRTVGRTPSNVINVSNQTPTGTFDNNSPFIGQPGMNPKLQQPSHKVPKTILVGHGFAGGIFCFGKKSVAAEDDA